MGSNRQLDLTLQLQELMHKVGINSFKELSRSTGTSAGTIAKIRSGQISTLRLQTIVKISGVLQISVLELIDLFSDRSILGSNYRSIEILQQEYQHLQQQFTQQRATLASEFQSQSLQTLESFLTYFPAAKYAAQNNPNFPASKILPLVQSIDRLISQWGVTIIGEIGTQLPYDSRWHQLIEGTAQTGDLVTVRYLGYQQGDKLIFRAKVSN
jgi:DNA-binding Xre family transcriptional regulator/molecular chaperone GrpE (heat shock protein)